ncbi:hypothetical protein BV898_12824 [Hypsibius exemplaris]|uniref:ATP-grasp domain-containing protein n=1 Tax=Hypsibius exemplaris TaxID=2072580 RepID=A0A1W0WCL1_HYPEX|nr:hypothetical protein BV898_12824 [Hypsibius exemplaris]
MDKSTAAMDAFTARSLRIRILRGDRDACDSSSHIPATLIVANEFSKASSCQYVETAFRALGFTKVSVHSVTLKNCQATLEEFVQYGLAHGNEPFLLFFTDCGLETDGFPGLTVLREMEKSSLVFTGADALFESTTVTKTNQKAMLISKGVSTAAFKAISLENVEADVAETAQRLSFPWIVKPSVSFAGVGISANSIVRSEAEAVRQINVITKELPLCRGTFVETFLLGREFTALVTGSAAAGVKTYTVAERVFRSDLTHDQRIIDFERGITQRGYRSSDDGSRKELIVPPETEAFYTSKPAPITVQLRLQQLAKDAYVAVNGSGYARIDIRSNDMENSEFFVLEVNPNPLIGENSSVGKILEYSGITAGEFMEEICQFAFNRVSPNSN